MYRISKSPLKTKKLRVFFRQGANEVHVDFGHTQYEDFTQHKDKARRKNYLTRSSGIRDSQGRLTKDNPFSANYWSRRILWASKEPFVGLHAKKTNK